MVELEVDSRDELGRMNAALNGAAHAMREALQQIADASLEIASLHPSQAHISLRHVA